MEITLKISVTNTRLLSILLLNAAGLLLFFSWYLPANHGFWYPIDSGLFHFFNQKIVESQRFLWFVAIINNRAFDGCSLLCMGLLMLWFWCKADPTTRRRIVLMGITMLFTAVVLNQLGQQLIPVKRPSPSLSFNDVVRVRYLLPAFSAKDASSDSFPSDHGMMLFIFSGYMWRYFGRTAFGIALLIVVVFSLPRIMIGAHWMTDIVVGSLSVVLIGLPWVLLTPLSDRIIQLLDSITPGKYKIKINR